MSYQSGTISGYNYSQLARLTHVDKKYFDDILSSITPAAYICGYVDKLKLW